MRLYGKLRCGGVTAEAFPSVDDVAAFIAAAHAARRAVQGDGRIASSGAPRRSEHRFYDARLPQHSGGGSAGAARSTPRRSRVSLRKKIQAHSHSTTSRSRGETSASTYPSSRGRVGKRSSAMEAAASPNRSRISRRSECFRRSDRTERNNGRPPRVVGARRRARAISRFRTCPSVVFVRDGCRTAHWGRDRREDSRLSRGGASGSRSTIAASRNSCRRRCSIRSSPPDVRRGRRCASVFRTCFARTAIRECASGAEHFLVDRDEVEMRVPMEIGDYVDFYSSIEHATNLGRLFRPNAEALLPNWRWLPVGYHGRSSSIVIDGTPVRRPCGQRKAARLRRRRSSGRAGVSTSSWRWASSPGRATNSARRSASPTRASTSSDSSSSTIGARATFRPGSISRSARSSAKSFATTISPWIVTLEALEPFRVEGPPQEPEPLEYLHVDEPWAYAIELAIDLQTTRMRELGIAPATISHDEFSPYVLERRAAARPRDRKRRGDAPRRSLRFRNDQRLRTRHPRQPHRAELERRAPDRCLPDGEPRSFLEDGDEITLRGWCEKHGARRIGFGTARGRIEPARQC